MDIVNDDLKVVIEFLDRCGAEAQGRQRGQPETEAAAKLERFAAGECDEHEREEVCRMLQMHPAWIRWVADRVKLARRNADASVE